MGKRKRKRKKKQRSQKYTKIQFSEIYCPNCEICLAEPTNPVFCHGELYKDDPKRFFRDCLSGLIDLKQKLRETGSNSKDINIEQFREVFCHNFCQRGVDWPDCGMLTDCLRLFRGQINGKMVNKAKMHRNKNRRRKEKQKYICQPYPTLFTSDNEEWQAKIEEILSNGNNNREQNKIEKSSEHSKG